MLLPAGSVVTSAAVDIILPTTTLYGSGVNYAENAFPPPDWNAPSIAPTFTNTGTSEVTVSANAITPLGFFDSPTPLIDGNEVSIGNFTFLIEIDGEIMGQLATSGVNWNGYVGGSGQVDIPYTVDLDVTYLPATVPEPFSFTLLGTGALGLAGIAYRRMPHS